MYTTDQLNAANIFGLSWNISSAWTLLLDIRFVMDPLNEIAAGAVPLHPGRGLHSSTFQHNLSRLVTEADCNQPTYPSSRAHLKPKSERVSGLPLHPGTAEVFFMPGFHRWYLFWMLFNKTVRVVGPSVHRSPRHRVPYESRNGGSNACG